MDLVVTLSVIIVISFAIGDIVNLAIFEGRV